MPDANEHPITTILTKAIQCNMRDNFVNIRLAARQSSAKTTLINQFEGNYGVDITRNYSTPSYIRGDKAKYIREHRIHTEIFEDVSWLKGSKNPAMTCDAIKQLIDGQAGANQYDSDNPAEVHVGVIITGTDDLFRRQNIITAYTSANLESRFVDIMYEYDSDTYDYIIKDMLERKQKGLPRFTYPHIDLSRIPYETQDLTDIYYEAVRHITTVPRIADQIFNLLKAGLPVEYLKFFQKPMKKINIVPHGAVANGTTAANVEVK